MHKRYCREHVKLGGLPRRYSRDNVLGRCACFFMLGLDDELSEIVPNRTLESVPDSMVLGILVPFFPNLRVKTL